MKQKIAIESKCHTAIIDKIDSALLSSDSIGLMLIDLSDFTQVNVGLGYAVGDQLLTQFKDRLCSLSCGLFMPEHYYGDKFVIICPTLKSDKRLEKYAQLLVNYFTRHSLSINALDVPIDLKLAYITSNSDSTGRKLLQALELTMFELKQKNINIDKALGDTELFLEGIYKNVSNHAVVRRAIERGEIINHYQPIIDLASSSIVACETLARWNNPTLGLMPPSAFLPHIAKHHQLVNFTLNIVRKVISDFKPILDQLPKDFYISVNLPPSMLVDRKSLSRMIRVIEDKGFPFQSLAFEITEQHLLSDFTLIDEMTRKLNNLGSKILIDDFGTGYSSIERIAFTPIYGLKLDKQFLLNKSHSELNKTVIKFALDVAKQKNAIMICEGVADKEILDALLALGVTHGQGFFFYKAVDITQLKQLVIP